MCWEKKSSRTKQYHRRSYLFNINRWLLTVEKDTTGEVVCKMITCFFHALPGSQAGYQAGHRPLVRYVCCSFEFVFRCSMKSDNRLGNWTHNFLVQQATVCYPLTVKKKRVYFLIKKMFLKDSQKFSNYALTSLMI